MDTIKKILAALPAWVKPRKFENEEHYRLCLLVYIISTLNGLNSLARALFALVTHTEPRLASVLTPLFFALMYLTALVLLQLGYLRTSGLINVFLQGSIILLVSLKFGGIQSGSFYVYPVFIIISSMLFGIPGAIWAGAFTFGTGFLLVFLENHALITKPLILYTSSIIFWNFFAPAIVSITIFMALQHHSLFSAISRARQSEHFIKHLAEMMPGFLYIYNLPAQKNSYSNRSLFSMLGYVPEKATPTIVEDMQALIHPHDLRERHEQHQQIATYTDNQVVESEFRVKHQLGEYRWLHSWEQIISRDTNKRPVEIIGVAQDVTEQRSIRELLRQKNEELERFIYTISHDLKSPLITITAYTDSLEQDIERANPERIARDLERVRTSTGRMQLLLQELLDFLRIGYLPNQPTEFSLHELIADARELIAGRLVERQVHIEVTAEPIMLRGDRPRLTQAMQNLLDNAVKFSSEQRPPQIAIDVQEQNKQLVLTIKDNGIGIAPEHQNKIFRLFEKIDPHAEGTGIGLVMVKRIIEVHEGKIWFESAGAQQGTTFFITWPGIYRGPHWRNLN